MDSVPYGQFDYHACTVGEDLRKEMIGLQWQQTALQFQQNRIMELLAHNQNRNKLRSPVFLCLTETLLNTAPSSAGK